MKKEGPKNPKKAIIYYYIIALVVLLLLNALVFPRMMQRQVSEVTYNQFIADLDAGKVSAVEENESEGTITYMMRCV